MYTATLTSQGQITIPSKIRKQLKLATNTQVVLSVSKNKLVLEPITDILSLSGILAHKSLLGKTSAQIERLEKAAIEQAKYDRIKRKIARESDELMII